MEPWAMNWSLSQYRSCCEFGQTSEIGQLGAMNSLQVLYTASDRVWDYELVYTSMIKKKEIRVNATRSQVHP